MGWEKNEKNGFCCERVSEGSQKPCPPQKKKVPSDSIPSLARHGHAPYQALRPGAPGASPLYSPDAGFSSPRINASQRTAACLRLSLTGPVARIGLSLACNNDASQRPHFRVKGPGLILRSLAPRLPRPFGHALHPRYRFAPVAAASLRLARCVSASGRLGLLPQPPLPFRAFTPVRIEAFGRFRSLPARLPNPPDLLSLPAALAFSGLKLRITVPGPLRFRRLAVPQTSWNLPHYARIRVSRQLQIISLRYLFLRNVGICFVRVTGRVAWMICE